MKRILAALIVLGTATALWVRWLRKRRDFGMKRLSDAIPVHSAYWREQYKRTGDLVYVVLGDSTAQGIGASKPNRGYVGKLARFIHKESGESVRVVNLSQSGARLREIHEVMMPRFAKQHPDILTVAIGANDIASFDEARFTRELDALYAALPGHAIVAEVPSFYFGTAEHKAQVANLIVHETAERYGLVVAPVYELTRRQTGAKYAFNQVADDFFHPNDRGYDVWTSAFEPLIAARIAELAHERENA